MWKDSENEAYHVEPSYLHTSTSWLRGMLSDKKMIIYKETGLRRTDSQTRAATPSGAFCSGSLPSPYLPPLPIENKLTKTIRGQLSIWWHVERGTCISFGDDNSQHQNHTRLPATDTPPTQHGNVPA